MCKILRDHILISARAILIKYVFASEKCDCHEETSNKQERREGGEKILVDIRQRRRESNREINILFNLLFIICDIAYHQGNLFYINK